MVNIKYPLPRSLWYNRKGKPLTTVDYQDNPKLWEKQMSEVEKLLRDREYKIVKQENLWWGGWLSTVWLGLDHSYMGSNPLIFETMLFIKRYHDIDMNRYSTEAEALQGHEQMKREWSKPSAVLKVLQIYLSELWETIKRKLVS